MLTRIGLTGVPLWEFPFDAAKMDGIAFGQNDVSVVRWARAHEKQSRREKCLLLSVVDTTGSFKWPAINGRNKKKQHLRYMSKTKRRSLGATAFVFAARQVNTWNAFKYMLATQAKEYSSKEGLTYRIQIVALKRRPEKTVFDYVAWVVLVLVVHQLSVHEPRHIWLRPACNGKFLSIHGFITVLDEDATWRSAWTQLGNRHDLSKEKIDENLFRHLRRNKRIFPLRRGWLSWRGARHFSSPAELFEVLIELLLSLNHPTDNRNSQRDSLKWNSNQVFPLTLRRNSKATKISLAVPLNINLLSASFAMTLKITV